MSPIHLGPPQRLPFAEQTVVVKTGPQVDPNVTARFASSPADTAGIPRPKTNQSEPHTTAWPNPGGPSGSITEGISKPLKPLAVKLLQMTFMAVEDTLRIMLSDALHAALSCQEPSDLRDSMQHPVELAVIGSFQENRIRASISPIPRSSVQHSQIQSNILQSFFESSEVVSTLTQIVEKTVTTIMEKTSTQTKKEP